MIRQGLLCIALALTAAAQELSLPFTFSLSENSQDPDYEKGLSNLDARRWEAAAANFDSASRKSALTDASLYWKAYALTHAGKWQESLSVLRRLQTSYPSSRWLKDAQALFMQIQSAAGHPVNPATQADEDLKLLALNTLMQQDPHAGLPALMGIINGAASTKTKEHALFVLAQSDAPEARKALLDFGRQSSNPALQMSAVRMMGMMGGESARKELAGLYKSSSDQAVKREILNGLMLSGSKSTLLTVARTESDPSLRNSAITNLSMTGGQVELSELYKSTAAPGEKRQILNTFVLTGDTNMLVDMLKHENDPELRVAAIRSLGAMSGQSATLTSLYRNDTNDRIRVAVLDALAATQNRVALVELAQGEKDQKMKAEIVRRIETVRTAETTRYLPDVVK